MYEVEDILKLACLTSLTQPVYVQSARVCNGSTDTPPVFEAHHLDR